MMDLASAACTVGGTLVGPNAHFARVNTDTRTARRGDLFVALKGERFDGHDFIDAAIAKGAVGALIEDDRPAAAAAGCIVVADSLLALSSLAASWRERFSIPVIAVTGSNGKTTVKEMIALILREQFGSKAVLATRGNLNNHIGLPLTLLELRDLHRCAVIEIGMNHPGETQSLAELTVPTIGLINNAQREHQEFLSGVADVAREHAAVFRTLLDGGSAVFNGDDDYADLWRAVVRERQECGVRLAVCEFGLRAAEAMVGATYTATDHGSEIVLRVGQEKAAIDLALPGEHSVLNALAAAATTHAAGVPISTIARALRSFRAIGGRLQVKTAVGGATLFDDTYNANPDSVRAAIAVLAAAHSPRILVLGDMGEVGGEGPTFHREIGAYARTRGIDYLLAFGDLSRESVETFGRNGVHCLTIEAVIAEARRHLDLEPESTILVKGSRFMRMERVVHALIGADSPRVPSH